jgi:hypothetical protein
MAESVSYKLVNFSKHDIGLTRPTKVEENIKPTRYVWFDKSEIQFEARALEFYMRSGAIRCDDPEPYVILGIDVDASLSNKTDDDIEKKLALPMKGFTTWIDSIDDEMSIRRVAEFASTVDTLSLKKIEMIEKKSGISIREARSVGAMRND